jgi:hypothetical protein
MANTKPIGVAYSDQDITGADTVSAGLMYSTAELGYATGAQGTVTQATSKSTGVTLNKSAGRITMNNAALAATTSISFTLTNSLISTNDTIVLNISGGLATASTYNAWVDSLSAGSAVITLRNVSAGSLSEAIILNYAIIHGA